MEYNKWHKNRIKIKLGAIAFFSLSDKLIIHDLNFMQNFEYFYTIIEVHIRSILCLKSTFC